MAKRTHIIHFPFINPKALVTKGGAKPCLDVCVSRECPVVFLSSGEGTQQGVMLNYCDNEKQVDK